MCGESRSNNWEVDKPIWLIGLKSSKLEKNQSHLALFYLYLLQTIRSVSHIQFHY
jgi:hypothetical protein